MATSNPDPGANDPLPAGPRTAKSRRPATASVVLHWLGMAALFAALAAGLFLHRLSSCCQPRYWPTYDLHASLGLAVLALVAMRALVRMLRPWPALPAGMPAWQRLAAHGTHTALYLLMVALPVAGWSVVSAPGCCHINPFVFGLFTLPSLDPAPLPDRAAALAVHSTLAWIAMGLVALHAAAALLHHVVLKDATLARVIPGLRPKGGPAP
ncbi:cytochrome b [Methylorubrum populi]|uniref:Cytochrome b/b6 domain-containing protein n=1 Tax=Methylorubrum rhodesianum TaxID=29427 RepID=A0ABU9ZCC1_9HYPH|nr:cytochrome b/b6 domain-containing protein [Methylorubrum rhodesianum]MBK3403972.1 cytochrome b [Methylorubrum rhodesianum]MBY0142771.1 cytochrome b [Methylorubrum populi]